MNDHIKHFVKLRIVIFFYQLHAGSGKKSKDTKYLLKFIFPFLRTGVEAKRGVEFRHLIRNASRIRRKVGNSVLILGSLCLPCYMRDIGGKVKKM